ncbi:CPBP family intramembrane glutamic endopeptidase [Hymenobacter rubidus]|uniref:CPBP family intramembrane glutamic endopeptidase n=1 Tax=Hymenobacter rubidus TaxID=1441626 RepID=UPI00191C9F94|nr:type II CAAX endopeptidase family protein [Hymenobacter rubidus]
MQSIGVVADKRFATYLVSQTLPTVACFPKGRCVHSAACRNLQGAGFGNPNVSVSGKPKPMLMINEGNQFFSKKVWIFLALTFLMTGIFDVTSVLLKVSGNAERLFTTAAMWCPAIAALLTKHICKEPINSLLWRWPKPKYLISAFFIPILYSLITYVIIWTVGFGKFYNADFVKGVATSFGISSLSSNWVIPLFVLMTGTFGLFRTAANALGEEIGWRGFLTPELYNKYGFIKTSLTVGIIWAVWHYTVLIFGDYNNGTPFWYGLTCFTVMIISSSFIFTWFTIKSGSLFPGMILHATHNLYIQQIFTPLTKNIATTPWYIDEFGIVLPLITTGFAIYFVARRKALNTTEANSIYEKGQLLTSALQYGG